jgi:hypothetical protein
VFVIPALYVIIERLGGRKAAAPMVRATEASAAAHPAGENRP